MLEWNFLCSNMGQPFLLSPTSRLTKGSSNTITAFFMYPELIASALFIRGYVSRIPHLNSSKKLSSNDDCEGASVCLQRKQFLPSASRSHLIHDFNYLSNLFVFTYER